MSSSATAVITPEVRTRLGWIDAVKGFTIILVVAHHALLGLVAAHRANLAVAYWQDILLTVRMPLFFMVAGLFARKSIFSETRSFIDGKVLHFAYFYVLWSLILFSIRYASNAIAFKKIEIGELLYIAWDPISTIWFLYALLIAFVLTRILRNLDPVFLVAGAAMMQAAAFSFPQIPVLVIINKFDYLYLYFLLGVFGSASIINAAGRSTRLWFAVCLIIFACLAIPLRFYELLQKPFTYFGLSIVGSFAVIFGMASMSHSILTRWFAWIGQYSMPIYLVHFLPVAATRFILLKVGVDNFWLLYASCVTVSIASAIAAYELTERTPMAFLFRRPTILHLKADSLQSGS